LIQQRGIRPGRHSSCTVSHPSRRHALARELEAAKARKVKHMAREAVLLALVRVQQKAYQHRVEQGRAPQGIVARLLVP
jgi:hypothetical protein